MDNIYPFPLKKKLYKTLDFIRSAKQQYDLHQTLLVEAIKLSIIKNTPVKILALDLNLDSSECNRINNLLDFFYLRRYDPTEWRHRKIAVIDYYNKD
jgi:Fe-S cluster biosynthesis and repair protein YggX